MKPLRRTALRCDGMRFRKTATRLFLGLGMTLLISGSARPVPAQDDAPTTRTDGLSEDERILHVLSRFTLGATPELVDEVRRKGIDRWLKEQFTGQLPESESYRKYTSGLKTLKMSREEIAAEYHVRPKGKPTPEEQKQLQRHSRIPMMEMMSWIFLRAVYGSNHLREVSSDFFRNHFSVSVDKGPVKVLVVDWEREIIHGQALGNFGDMLEATAKHPAMLHYLDNELSRKPATAAELKKLAMRVRRRTGSKERAEEQVDIASQRGLNENYARELLELHTLGVDNYYRQADVLNLAKILTGWSTKKNRRLGGQVPEAGFNFYDHLHCDGDKPFLGGVIRENRRNPVAEGEKALEILKTHEGTAHYLSWKLCRYFVNDDPDREMVGRVAGVFSKTGGDLPKVFGAIVNDPGFFTRKNYRAKFKRPTEFVVSALRVTKAEIVGSSDVGGRISRGRGTTTVGTHLSSMNERLYRCADPTGYYDQAEAWRDPGALAIRWNFASDLVAGKISGFRIPSSFYKGLPENDRKAWKDILVKKILPVTGVSRVVSKKMDEVIMPYLEQKSRISGIRLRRAIVAMLLGSPEFQKQ